MMTRLTHHQSFIVRFKHCQADGHWLAVIEDLQTGRVMVFEQVTDFRDYFLARVQTRSVGKVSDAADEALLT